MTDCTDREPDRIDDPPVSLDVAPELRRWET